MHLTKILQSCHYPNFNRVVLLLFLSLTATGAPARDAKGGLSTVCIDPGHGGTDPGCITKAGGITTTEKEIVLDIGLFLRDMLAAPQTGIKPVMTRSDDRFIPLDRRAAIAGDAGADLFISIHINSLDLKRNPAGKNTSGFSVHTLGKSRTGRNLLGANMELCKRENSVILLENDYSAKYEGFDPSDPASYIIFNLMQNANLEQSLSFAQRLCRSLEKGPVSHSRGVSQDPFLVLWKTTMPAVLLECGFITNASDLAAFRSKESRKKIAKQIFEAIMAFKTEYDSSVKIGSGPSSAETQATAPAPVAPATGQAPATPANGPSAPQAAGSAQTASAAGQAPATPVAAPLTMYGTQVLASSKKISPDDKFFAGQSVTSVFSDGLWRYYLGVSADRQEARKNFNDINKKFPGSFFATFLMDPSSQMPKK